MRNEGGGEGVIDAKRGKGGRRRGERRLGKAGFGGNGEFGAAREGCEKVRKVSVTHEESVSRPERDGEECARRTRGATDKAKREKCGKVVREIARDFDPEF